MAHSRTVITHRELHVDVWHRSTTRTDRYDVTATCDAPRGDETLSMLATAMRANAKEHGLSSRISIRCTNRRTLTIHARIPRL